jgi:hypothetical protein
MTRINLEMNISKGINFFESQRTMRNGTCTIHNLVIDPRDIDLSIAVNSLANNYHWADCTVRGLVPYEDWMKEYFEETSRLFRAKSVKDYAKDNPKAICVSEANGNLFWNLGSFVFSNGNLFQHYREKFHGKQVALVHAQNGHYEIGAIDFNQGNPFKRIDYAVSGIPIITNGIQSQFFEPHQLTGRLLIAEFFGDMSQLLNTAMCVPLNRHLFYSLSQVEPEEVNLKKMSDLSRKVFEKDIKNKLSKYQGLSSGVLYSAMHGEPIRVRLDNFESEQINQNLNRFGYENNPKLQSIGDYCIDNKFLNIRLLRATFGHGLTSICKDGIVLFTKVYTDETRKGGYIEDMAEVVTESASDLGLIVKDTLVTSNGGDLRIYMPNSSRGFLSHSNSGMPLSYKGDINYGISSAFLIRGKN